MFVMKRKLLFSLPLIFGILYNLSVNGQLPKLDKIKVPSIKKTNSGSSENGTSNETTKTENSNSTTSSSNIGNVSLEEQEAWYYFYKAATQECESRVWIEGLYDDYLLSSIGFNYDRLSNLQLLCIGLTSRIETDKKKSPATFLFYGDKTTMPKGMEYGGANNEALPSKLRWTNNSVIKYYQWKDRAANLQESVSKCILKYVESSKESISGNPDLTSRLAYEYIVFAKELITAFEYVQGKNPHLSDASQKTEEQRIVIVNLIKSKLTGKFHENNLQKVIGFSQKQTLGSEDESQIIQELTPGKFAHIIAYSVEPQNRFGAKSAESTGGRETQPSIFITYQHPSGNIATVIQKIYCNKTIFTKMKDQFFVEFEWFPDLATVNYKSHLEYMPILHLGEYLTSLPNGNYPINFMFGSNIFTDVSTRGKFSLIMNDEIKSSLKKYLDALWLKKLENVTFNSQYGDKDQRSDVVNWEELKKYGYPEKLTVQRTGTVMKPWPNDSEVESFVGSGWGLFKKEDGKYEVIGLSFVQKPGDQKWKWTSIASDMDYYVLTETGNSSTVRVQPKRLSQGYEIPSANISKNLEW